MRTGLPKSSVAPRRANITIPRCQSRAAAPRPRERSRHPHITALIVAERRHSAITRYAERSAAQRAGTRHAPAVGVPEVRHYSRAGVRPRERSRLQLTPDSVGGTRTDADAPRTRRRGRAKGSRAYKKIPQPRLEDSKV